MSNDQPDTTRTAIIRNLNDQFRKTFSGGAVVITAGIAALDEATQQRIFAAIQAFDAFDETMTRLGGAKQSLDGRQLFARLRQDVRAGVFQARILRPDARDAL